MTDYQGTDDYTDYLFQSPDETPVVSEIYEDVSDEFKIQSLDISYFDFERVEGSIACPRLKAVWSLLCDKFNTYYATREIGGYSEYDFFCMMLILLKDSLWCMTTILLNLYLDVQRL